MVRTRSTRRHMSREEYAKRQRSSADVAARVPPTQYQFDLALLEGDANTILDYLQLNHEALTALDTSNANCSRPQPSHNDVGEDEIMRISSPAWCQPTTITRGMISRVSLFQKAAKEGWIEMIEWFFCSPDHIARWGMLLRKAITGTILKAAMHGHLLIVETVLSSSVYIEYLDAEDQQNALQSVFDFEEDPIVADLLLAHGAIESFAVDADGGNRMDPSYPIADASHLFVAVTRADDKAVKNLVIERFVDVDARNNQGATALITCVQQRIKQMIGVPGRSALHYAIEGGAIGLVTLLLDHITNVYGVEAVHSDVIALDLTHAQCESNTTAAAQVLSLLFHHGACVRAYDRLSAAVTTSVVTGRQSCALCRVQSTPITGSKRKYEDNRQMYS